MDEYLRRIRKWTNRFLGLAARSGRLKGVKKTTKIHVLLAIILVLCARLFFSTLIANYAWAEPAEQIKPMTESEALDPLNKIKSLDTAEEKPIQKTCLEREVEKPSLTVKKEDDNQEKYMELVADYPMAEMVPYIAKREKKTAAFLISIAKKESDWGKHSPSKNGQHCYNYWGYKGGYNLTDSGYSCFDSAEQAIQVVGERIDELVAKNLDTPQKMVIWKCGGNCASDNQAGNWIAAVNNYFKKLDS